MPSLLPGLAAAHLLADALALIAKRTFKHRPGQSKSRKTNATRPINTWPTRLLDGSLSLNLGGFIDGAAGRLQNTLHTLSHPASILLKINVLAKWRDSCISSLTGSSINILKKFMKNIILKIYEKLLRITIVTVITLTFVNSAYASPAFSISKTEWQTIVNYPFPLDWQLSTTDGIKATQFELWINPITSFDDASCLFIPDARFYDATVPESDTVVLIALGLIVLTSGGRKKFYK